MKKLVELVIESALSQIPDQGVEPSPVIVCELDGPGMEKLFDAWESTPESDGASLTQGRSRVCLFKEGQEGRDNPYVTVYRADVWAKTIHATPSSVKEQTEKLGFPYIC